MKAIYNVLLLPLYCMSNGKLNSGVRLSSGNPVAIIENKYDTNLYLFDHEFPNRFSHLSEIRHLL